jgi:hypothetical protein
MKTLRFTLAIVAAVLLLNGCSHCGQSPTRLASNFIQRQSIVATTKESYPSKNPQTVAMYTPDRAPTLPYRVIGVATISKRNLLGMERHETTMHTMMKQLAASVGGDGLINVNSDKEAMQAHIIAFQRILI